MRQKYPQVVKHVVKGEKWACSTLKIGKNKPSVIITKKREFARKQKKIGGSTEPPILKDADTIDTMRNRYKKRYIL